MKHKVQLTSASEETTVWTSLAFTNPSLPESSLISIFIRPSDLSLLRSDWFELPPIRVVPVSDWSPVRSLAL